MKRTVAITVATLLLIVFAITCRAQVSITPVAGINSVRMYDGIVYDKGGNYGLAGLELELRRKPKIQKRFYVSAVTGASYLRNGFYDSFSFSFASLFYSQQQSNLDMQFVQIPVELKFNWRPFALIEDWTVFAGGGVSYDLLLNAHLEEKSTRLDFDTSQPPAPPTTITYSDNRDVTNMMPSHLLFYRFEIGVNIKRIHLAWRMSSSLTDAYPTGLERNWQVPADDSTIIEHHHDAGSLKFRYNDLVIGYTFSRK
ncbi:MAG TPA: hypothetical protein VF473_11365 [Cyclobacteriaceae bacterium]